VLKADDPSEKPLEGATEVRCVKKLHVCIRARNEKASGFLPGMAYIDIFDVRSWSNTEVRATASAQPVVNPGCEEVTLVINRVERSVLLMSSPGPMGSQKRCTGNMGPPKTVVYRLEMEWSK
jgi:hypothetical protein